MNDTTKRFLEEAKSLEGRWAKTGLLEGLDKRFTRGQTAVLLECERLINEQAPCGDSCPMQSKDCPVRARGDCPNNLA